MVSDGNSRNKSNKKILPGTEEDLQIWGGISAAATPEEEVEEKLNRGNLRPSGFKEYIGQDTVKKTLLMSCHAARRRGDALDHVLLHGPPGLGKTSLARIVATELNVDFKSTSGPVIEKPGDLAAILTSLKENDVLFIDEIHRMPRVVEEVLYPAMEDFEIDILIGHGPAAKSVKIELKPFTLVGATTRTGLLTSPLRDRFGIALRLNFYEKNDLQKIISRSADILGINIEDAAAFEIGQRSRGTPRIANRLLKRVRDFAEESGAKTISPDIASKALEMLHIDSCGLDEMDRNILNLIVRNFNGGPVGIETIAAAIGEEKNTLEDVYEPFLIQEGFLARTRQGRKITELGYAHIGVKPKQQALSL